jgi:predicted nuclease with TOPRIM domain
MTNLHDINEETTDEGAGYPWPVLGDDLTNDPEGLANVATAELALTIANERIAGLEAELAEVGTGNIQLMAQVDEWRSLVHARNETIADLEATRDRLGGQLNARQAELDQARRLNVNLSNQHETWKDTLIRKAHAEADARDWCEDFDEWMEEQGLRGRTHDYDVQVQVTTTVTISVEARSAATAMEQITLSEVREKLADFDGWDYQDIDWDAQEAERG